MPSPIGVADLSAGLPYTASDSLGSLYLSPRTMMAQAIRAILLASATAATFVGRRSINRPSQGRFSVPCLRAYSADELDCWAPSKADLRPDCAGRHPGCAYRSQPVGVERGMRPLLYAGHSFRGVTLRIDHELTGSACRDAPHRAAEQVRQLPNCASLCGCDDIGALIVSQNRHNRALRPR